MEKSVPHQHSCACRVVYTQIVWCVLSEFKFKLILYKAVDQTYFFCSITQTKDWSPEMISMHSVFETDDMDSLSERYLLIIVD